MGTHPFFPSAFTHVESGASQEKRRSLLKDLGNTSPIASTIHGRKAAFFLNKEKARPMLRVREGLPSSLNLRKGPAVSQSVPGEW